MSTGQISLGIIIFYLVAMLVITICNGRKKKQKSAEGFVRIGYLLKLARDTDVLKGSGYASVNEFAREEYNIDKTMVSRFIGINDRFSEGGNSPQLKEQYRNFGYSKLAIMLQLPDSINEELTPAFSKSEILAVKEEYDAEMEKTDLEVMMEEKPEGQQDMDELSKAIWQLGHDSPELYKEIYGAVKSDGSYKALQEAIAPAGEGICSVRIPGTGRMLLSVKGTDSDITLTNIRTGEKKGCAWESLHRAVCRIIRLDSKSPETSWEKVYGEPFPIKKEPEEPKVAPVQQKKEDKKPKKQPKVIRAKAEEKPVNTQWEEAEQKEGSSREDKTEKETSPSCEVLHGTESTGNETESAGSETSAIENVTEISEIVTETPLGGLEADKSGNEKHENGTEIHENTQNGQETDVCLPKPQMTQEEFLARRKEYNDKILMGIFLAQKYMKGGEYLRTKDKMEKCIEWIDGLEELDRENRQYLNEMGEENKAEKEDKEDADEQ